MMMDRSLAEILRAAIVPATGDPIEIPAPARPHAQAPDAGAAPPPPRPAAPALSPALDQVAALRRQQIDRHGHTAAADDAQPLQHFARLLRQFTRDVGEDIQFNRPEIARRHAIKLAAVAVALADRLQRDAVRQPEDPFA